MQKTFARLCLSAESGRYDNSLFTCQMCMLNRSQALTEVVLFSHVSFFDPDVLLMFERRLRESSMLCNQSNNVGHLVQILYTEDLGTGGETIADDPDIIEAISSILLHTDCLRELTLMNITITRSQLTTLSRSCSTTLISLYIQIDPSADGVFPILNSLRNLKELGIEVNAGTWEHAIDYPLNVPTVIDACWCMAFPYQDDRLRFLSRCTFAAGCSLELVIHELTPESVPIISPLFNRNMYRRLNLSLPQESLSVLLPDIREVPRLSFCMYMPPLSMLDMVSEVEEITFETPLARKGQRYETDFWNFLTQLSHGDPLPKGKSTTVKIGYEQQSEFDWMSGSPDSKMLVEQLKPLATALLKRGIVVVDKAGCDVSTA
jgi:hypothetical protein